MKRYYDQVCLDIAKHNKGCEPGANALTNKKLMVYHKPYIVFIAGDFKAKELKLPFLSTIAYVLQ